MLRPHQAVIEFRQKEAEHAALLVLGVANDVAQLVVRGVDNGRCSSQEAVAIHPRASTSVPAGHMRWRGSAPSLVPSAGHATPRTLSMDMVLAVEQKRCKRHVPHAMVFMPCNTLRNFMVHMRLKVFSGSNVTQMSNI